MNMVLALDFLKASLGPAVAALGVAVAVAQWHTNTVKLRLDTYDRRLRVYKAVVSMLDAVLNEIAKRRGPTARRKNGEQSRPYGGLPDELVANFADAALEAPFLFDRDIAVLMHRIDHQRSTIRMYANYCAEIAPEAHETHRDNFRRLTDLERDVEKTREMVQHRFEAYLALNPSRRS
ncbi:hypothetical protein GTY70_05995 [Stenotrophomonas maltophilia]|uniref:hypothetical protein n=1 Tax=Stenotrophomonas maltophilia group TaxID=995085 RepID=UPI001F2E8DAA|nr:MULTISPECIES: hypothetical protein [Stenotrophomonas]MCF3463433.1 hypothetical protein [Stenotrophomonas maltophilia]MCF3507950.1 hypothetical protein [Stenotrophomonas maltophilia]MCU1082902.1 hypothetical protein [Stenotrophomonas maltophilia]MCU1155827.1 hypothetical protein [Stenotrophomonas maltophilia]MCU1167018.1 hypothetical protein [Stenotrophomonas maltophilia]